MKIVGLGLLFLSLQACLEMTDGRKDSAPLSSPKPQTTDPKPAPADPWAPTFQNVQKQILNQCGPCHLEGNALGGFNAESLEKVMDAVVAGNAELSLLYFSVGPDGNMPPKADKISQQALTMLRDWINSLPH